MVRIAATDHHQVDAVGQPLVTQRREFDQLGPQRFERFQCIGEIAAKSLVLGVSHAETPAAAQRSIQAREIGLLWKRA